MKCNSSGWAVRALQLCLRAIPVIVALTALASSEAQNNPAATATTPATTTSATTTATTGQKGDLAELSSKGPQRRVGDVYIADDEVDIRFNGARLQADHVEYNNKTFEAIARGHVVFDFESQHLQATEASYNVRSGQGVFGKVQGTVKIQRTPNPALLISENPLYFEADQVERTSLDTYVVEHAWITICDPDHPKWQFFAPHAKIQLDKTVALVNANFRLFRVPLVWLPYATTPAGRRVRQSGFLIPDLGQSSRKGFIFGDAFYWAPAPWLDATLGAQYLSRRGATERGEFRAKPLENTSINYSYYGVDDRGLLDATGVRHPQGGEEQRLEIQSLLPHGWRFVTDYNQVSSLTFRLAFADTFGEAINSEVRSSIFLSNNYHGFSLNFAGLNDRSFLTLPTNVAADSGSPAETIPAATVNLRSLPEARFSSVEQSPFRNLPFYFSFESLLGAVHREDENVAEPSYVPVDTPAYVSRTEFAPKVTVPLHFGPWFGVTTSAAFRTTHYGDALEANGFSTGQGINRNDGEFEVELRPGTLERIYAGPKRKIKHSIEPELTYRYVTGINNFGDFIRFDSNATLSNTNEVEYGVTQRLWAKKGDGQAQEFLSWRLAQKHYFDPTFGGAIVSGQRNVLATLDSISPFAFAFGPRNWSPVLSDLRITPGGPYDIEQILQYDTQTQRLVTVGTLLKVKPYSQFFATVAHFRLNDNPSNSDLNLSPPVLTPFRQPVSNQVRALFGYGGETRKGFNFTGGVSYDFTNNTLQSQLVQFSYNGSCCGLAVEYRRINLGQVRTENQFRVAFIIANIGNFGNLRHQERIF